MTFTLERVSHSSNGHHGPGRWWEAYEITPNLLERELGRINLPRPLPKRIIVVDSESGRRLLMGRHIWGWHKIRLIKEVTRFLVQPVVDLFKEAHGEVTQFVPLNGAIPMQIGKALHHALIDPFRTAPIATVYLEAERRLTTDGKRFSAGVQKPLKAYPMHSTVVIVDTCSASGETMKAIVRNIIRWYKVKNKQIKRIIFFTACGSFEAIVKSAAVCQKYGIDFIPIFSVGIHRVFPEPGILGLPYTDLSPIADTAIMPQSFVGSASVYYQGKPMCAVGDVGDSIGPKFEEYLFLTLRELARLQMNLKASPWHEMLRQIPHEILDRLQREFYEEWLYIIRNK